MLSNPPGTALCAASVSCSSSVRSLVYCQVHTQSAMADTHPPPPCLAVCRLLHVSQQIATAAAAAAAEQAKRRLEQAQALREQQEQQEQEQGADQQERARPAGASHGPASAQKDASSTGAGAQPPAPEPTLAELHRWAVAGLGVEPAALTAAHSGTF